MIKVLILFFFKFYLLNNVMSKYNPENTDMPQIKYSFMFAKKWFYIEV